MKVELPNVGYAVDEGANVDVSDVSEVLNRAAASIEEVADAVAVVTS